MVARNNEHSGHTVAAHASALERGPRTGRKLLARDIAITNNGIALFLPATQESRREQ